MRPFNSFLLDYASVYMCPGGGLQCSFTIWWQVITPLSVLITAQSRGGCVTRDSGQARDNHCDAETGPE